MKRKFTLCLTAIFMLACTLLPLLAACDGSRNAASGYDTLVIYNWEDYIDSGDSEMGRSDLRDEFERYYENVTGRPLRITYTTYDTNETMMTKVLKNDANVDLICPSEYSIEKLLLAGLLENHNDLMKDIAPQLADIEKRLDGLDKQKLGEQELADIEQFDASLGGMSSLKNNGDGSIEPKIMSVIRNMFSNIEGVKGAEGAVDMTEYMVPYMYGTLGILYNTNVISEQELENYGWGVLWNVMENEQLENKILMKDSVRDTYAAALFYLYEYDLLPEKYDYITTAQELINLTDPDILETAEEALTSQRDHISGYEVDFGKDDMLNEIVYADFAWSGDALWAVEESEQDDGSFLLGYYCPTGVNPNTGKERFSNIWYDGWVIPTTVKNKLAAMMFIDYMCKPQSAIRNSVAIGYSSAASKELLMGDEYVKSFLEDQEYDFDEYFDDIGRYPKIDYNLGVMRDFGARNEDLVNMWQRAKSGAGVDVSLFIIIAAIIGAVAIAVALYFVFQALKCRPRRIVSKRADNSQK